MKISYIKLKTNRLPIFSVSFLLILIVIVSTFFAAFTIKHNGDCFAESSVEPQNRIIIIDAGHGGEDSGATSKNGLHEKYLNLEIALNIGNKLEEKGYKVIYTRTEDKLLYTEEQNIHGIRKISDLKNRCKIANDNPEAIFISIHMNSFSQPQYSGLQVYYSVNNESSKYLADSIQSRIREDMQRNNTRKIKAGNNIYLMENINNVAILIECGFLTNEDEAKKLSEKEYQNNLSFSIVCGIIDYIKHNTNKG